MLKSTKKIVTSISVATGLVVLVVAGIIAIDQAIYPKNEINPVFADKSLKDKELSERGIVLFDAMCYQLEKELNSTFGWTPNDIFVLRLFDNKLNCQKGVIHAVREVANVLSVKITKLGFGDQENADLKTARQSKFAFAEDEWGWYNAANSEGAYFDGIGLVRKFQGDLRAGRVNINVSTSDLYEILVAIKENVLGEPYGRLINRNRGVSVYIKNSDSTGKSEKVTIQDGVPYDKIDDAVYYAQGTAIVARDVLSVLFNAFRPELAKGAEANMRVAIDDLDAVARFNPYWVERGEGDSMLADHRSKMARYYADAISRIEDVAKSISR